MERPAHHRQHNAEDDGCAECMERGAFNGERIDKM